MNWRYNVVKWLRPSKNVWKGSDEKVIEHVPQPMNPLSGKSNASNPSTKIPSTLSSAANRGNLSLDSIAPATPAAGASISRPPLAKRKVRSLGLRASERLLLLGLIDVTLISAALIAALFITSVFVPTIDSIAGNLKWFVTLLITWLGCANFFDCYNLARAASTTASVRNIVLAAGITVAVYTLIPFLTPPLVSRGTLFVFGGLALIMLIGWRVIYAQLVAQPVFQQRALIVGAGTAGVALIKAMQDIPRRAANPFRGTGYEIVGFVDDDQQLHGQTISGVSVVGDNQTLAELAITLHINEIILAITNTQTISDEMMDSLLKCRELGLRITTMATVYERLLGRVPIDYVGRDLYLVLPMEDNAIERAYKIVKRVIDVAAAAAGLAVMGIAVIPIALVNRITSPGPLFYKQLRVGQGGKLFEMYKFRSMRPDAERGTGAVWARRGDIRITPAGRIIRKTRIDELPQFINVLKGDMSIIGPRPERPEFVNALALMIPYYRARHAVKPGITGWAQIKFGYGSTHEDSRIKLEHDLYYVKHASPFLDTLILLQTLPVMLLGKGT